MHVGLLGIVGSHLPSTLGEALFQTGENFRVAAKLESQRLGYGFARQVVFGRTEASAEDDDVGAKEAVLRRRHQATADCPRQCF